MALSISSTHHCRFLCLVSVIKRGDAKDKKGLLDYNAHIFQDALADVFARGWEKHEGGPEGVNGGESARGDHQSH